MSSEPVTMRPRSDFGLGLDQVKRGGGVLSSFPRFWSCLARSAAGKPRGKETTMGSSLGLLGATCTRMGVVPCEESSSWKVACFRFLCDFLEADSMVGIVWWCVCWRGIFRKVETWMKQGRDF